MCGAPAQEETLDRTLPAYVDPATATVIQGLVVRDGEPVAAAYVRLLDSSGDFTAEVTVSGTYPENAETVVANRRPWQGAGLLLWVDSRTYVRLERAHLEVTQDGSTARVDYPSWEIRLEGKWLRAGSGRDGTLASPTMSASAVTRSPMKPPAVCRPTRGARQPEADGQHATPPEAPARLRLGVTRAPWRCSGDPKWIWCLV